MPASSVSVKLTIPRVTRPCTARPLGVVTVTVVTPWGAGRRIGCPAANWKLDWSSAAGCSQRSVFESTSGKATRSGKSVLNRSKPTKSALRSGSSSA